jgi:hypothetical protein
VYGVPGLSVYAEQPGATATLVEDLRRTAAALETNAVAVHVRDLATIALSGLAARRPEAASHENR